MHSRLTTRRRGGAPRALNELCFVRRPDDAVDDRAVERQMVGGDGVGEVRDNEPIRVQDRLAIPQAVEPTRMAAEQGANSANHANRVGDFGRGGQPPPPAVEVVGDNGRGRQLEPGDSVASR